MSQYTAACCLVINDNQILQVSRRNNPNDWGLPGGKIDIGETSLEAALRELYEETGVTAIEDDCIPVYYGEEAITYLILRYDVEDLKKPTGEGDVRWGSKEALCSGSFGAYNTEMLKSVLKIKAVLQDLIRI